MQNVKDYMAVVRKQNDAELNAKGSDCNLSSVAQVSVEEHKCILLDIEDLHLLLKKENCCARRK